MKNLTREEFDTRLKMGEKFIVDFYASWCGPCKMMMPIVERVHNHLTETESVVNIYKFDIDEDKSLAVELGIRGVPTIKAFSNGQEVFSKSGIMMENEIKNLAGSILNG